MQGGCPIANLLGQLGERDDAIRAVLASGFDRWETAIRAGLAAMVESGELRPDADAEWLAAVDSGQSPRRPRSLAGARETRSRCAARSTAPSPS